MKLTLHVHRKPKHRLDLNKIIATAKNLTDDIHARLPQTSLAKLADELLQITEATEDHLQRANRPIIAIRVSTSLAAVLGLLGMSYLIHHLKTRWEFGTISEFVEGTDAGFNLILILAGALWSLLTLESRIKRKEILGSIEELREFVHVIDLTQLYYTPELYRARRDNPRSSRILDDSYLLFCTQMLGVLGNLASLYTRGGAGDSILRAASEVEMLAIAISTKQLSKAEAVRKMAATIRQANSD
jgi:hypothetical protein